MDEASTINAIARQQILGTPISSFGGENGNSRVGNRLYGHLAEGMVNADGTPMEFVDRKLEVIQGEQHEPHSYGEGAHYPGLKKSSD